MIKSVLFTGMLLCLSVPAFGLEVNEKFGKPTMEEMEMTVYDADPEADAVVLYKEGNVNYRFDASSTSGFIIEYDVVERIKVLTSDGVDLQMSVWAITIQAWPPIGQRKLSMSKQRRSILKMGK